MISGDLLTRSWERGGEEVSLITYEETTFMLNLLSQGETVNSIA